MQKFPPEKYEVLESCSLPDAIIVRSFDMHDMELPETLIAVGRAGAGVNNIPLKRMSQNGIVVFNAPGANANAVKELAVAGMLMSCRNIFPAWVYTQKIKGDDEQIRQFVEAGKKKYIGFELPHKTLGVIGLGAIGVKLANAAVSLGMSVIGYDPDMSITNAWNVSADVKKVTSIDGMMGRADFISLHVPFTPATQNIIDARRLNNMKQGGVIMNFARHGLVDEDAVLQKLDAGHLHAYVTDFPSRKTIGHQSVITLPHLGASTYEAEQNCAVIVAAQLIDYLENGNISNSVNFPDVHLQRSTDFRLSIVNVNRPDMVGQISRVLGKNNINIHHMINDSRAATAYTLLDLDMALGEKIMQQIRAIDGVLAARTLW